MRGSHRNRMTRRSVSVVRPAVERYDACWTARPAGADAAGGSGRTAGRDRGGVDAMSSQLVRGFADR